MHGDILIQNEGLLLAFEDNMVTSFGCKSAQDWEELFVEFGINVYTNMM